MHMSYAGRTASLIIEYVSTPWAWGGLLTAFLVGGFYLAPFLSLRGSRLWVPIFGKLVQQVLVSRFCRVLGLLAGRGVPLPAALRLAGAAADSVLLASQAAGAAAGVEAGRPLSEAVEMVRVLPATARWGIAAAAARGGLADELQAIARAADENAADLARRFAVVMETSLILLIGFFVLFGAGGSIVRSMFRVAECLQLFFPFID